MPTQDTRLTGKQHLKTYGLHERSQSARDVIEQSPAQFHAGLPDEFFPAHLPVALIGAIFGVLPRCDGRPPAVFVQRFCNRFGLAPTRPNRWHPPPPEVQASLDDLIGHYETLGVDGMEDTVFRTRCGFPDPTGQRATAIRFERRPRSGSMMTHPGVYCLRSNATGWDEATLWRTYFTLTDLEAVFRSLKSELGLRPIYHHKPIRAEGHLVHHRDRVSTCAGDSSTPARERRVRELDHTSPDPGTTATHHRYLAPHRRADAARAQSHTRRTASAGHLRRLGHRPCARRYPQEHRVEDSSACSCSAIRPFRTS